MKPSARYYRKNRARLLAAQKIYYRKNRASVIAYNARRREEKREEINAKGKEWRKANGDLSYHSSSVRHHGGGVAGTEGQG